MKCLYDDHHHWSDQLRLGVKITRKLLDGYPSALTDLNYQKCTSINSETCFPFCVVADWISSWITFCVDESLTEMTCQWGVHAVENFLLQGAQFTSFLGRGSKAKAKENSPAANISLCHFTVSFQFVIVTPFLKKPVNFYYQWYSNLLPSLPIFFLL